MGTVEQSGLKQLKQALAETNESGLSQNGEALATSYGCCAWLLWQALQLCNIQDTGTGHHFLVLLSVSCHKKAP